MYVPVPTSSSTNTDDIGPTNRTHRESRYLLRFDNQDHNRQNNSVALTKDIHPSLTEQ